MVTMEGMPHTQEHQQSVMEYTHNTGLNQQSPWNAFQLQNLHLLLMGSCNACTVQLQ